MRKERIRLDINYCLDSVVGSERGLSKSDLAAFTNRLEAIHKEFEEERKLGHHAFREVPFDTDTVKAVEDFAGTNRGKYSDLIVVGIGGSSLGARALISALGHPLHNVVSREQRGDTPRIFFVENPDPTSIRSVLEIVNPESTLVNVITKSGSTAETMAGFLLVYEFLKEKAGESAVKENIIATTDPDDGDLRKMAMAHGWRTFDVPRGVGGRFSVLTPVGLVPASLCGIDIDTLVDGARDMEEQISSTSSFLENPAYAYALIQYLMEELNEIRLSVFMPYSDRLSELADWFRQLWAESLGKKSVVSKETIHTGPTPIKSLGAIDQHSQVQLYVDGPADKMFTFIEVRDHSQDMAIPSLFSDYDSCSYLGGKTFGELLNTELRATEYALTRAGRPNITLQIPEVSPNFLGEVMTTLLVSTVVAGKLYDVNPYDQPGVEQGKKATYALMGRSGYTDIKAEYTSRFPKDPKLIC